MFRRRINTIPVLQGAHLNGLKEAQLALRNHQSIRFSPKQWNGYFSLLAPLIVNT